MKIEFNKITKKYGPRSLFKDFSFSFKENGFYFITGKSGCGKTTILNILSLIDTDYSGEYLIDGIDAKLLHSSEKSSIRSGKFGYVYQNFNLFEDDTVDSNISIMLEAIGKTERGYKEQRKNEILNLLGIGKLRYTKVKNLSGGEKQRVAIARALMTSPEVIFCDEPTGSLDSVNSENIFSILKSISKDTLVICVTHDKDSALKYADVILSFDENHIRSKKFKNEVSDKSGHIKIMKIKKKNRFAKLHLPFLTTHLKNKYKDKKFRNIIKNFLLMISLISTGLSLGLTTGIKDAILNSFGNVITSNTIVLKRKDSKNSIFDFYSSGESTVVSLLNEYKDDLDYYGANYIVDFENFFPDGNDLFMESRGKRVRVDGFNIRMFNEFVYVKDVSSLSSYPLQDQDLKDDEIILSLDYEQMKNICLNLQIIRSFDSLGEYIKNNDLMVTLCVKNDSWQYVDEQIFRVKGVIMDAYNRVYHTNNLFNKTLFEENMFFPVSNRLNKIEDYPWIFKKVYYVHTKNFQSEFLNKVFYNEKRSDLLFDSDNKTYSPLSCPYDLKITNKLFVYNIFKDGIDVEIFKQLEDLNFKYRNYYFSTPMGYFNNGVSLFSGFSRPVFISNNIEKIETIIDAHSKVDEKDLYNVKVPENVVDAYAFKPSSNNVKLKIVDETLNVSEVVVSKGFENVIGEEISGKTLYFSMLTKSEKINEKVNNTFSTIKLTVKRVEESDESVAIYQNKDFSISLFRDLLKISSFNLLPNSIVFETETLFNESDINKLNNFFSDYEFSNPLLTIEESINESLHFLNVLLYMFSVFAIISSCILLLIITLISVIEMRKEIAIFTILGFRKFEIFKLFLIENLANSEFLSFFQR